MNKQLYVKQWKVPSASGGEAHKVLMKKDRTLSCDCMGWRYRRTCRHTEAVRIGKAGKSSPVLTDKPGPQEKKVVLKKQSVKVVKKFSDPTLSGKFSKKNRRSK